MTDTLKEIIIAAIAALSGGVGAYFTFRGKASEQKAEAEAEEEKNNLNALDKNIAFLQSENERLYKRNNELMTKVDTLEKEKEIMETQYKAELEELKNQLTSFQFKILQMEQKLNVE
jgi:peroxiredoxin family protein